MSNEMTQNDVKRIIPKNGHILVRPIAKEEVTKGGIFLPDNQKTGAHTQAEVVAWDADIDNRMLGLSLGTKVIFNKFSYTEIKVPSKNEGGKDLTFLMIKEENIQGIIE